MFVLEYVRMNIDSKNSLKIYFNQLCSLHFGVISLCQRGKTANQKAETLFPYLSL